MINRVPMIEYSIEYVKMHLNALRVVSLTEQGAESLSISVYDV